jgi:hypothetical protein
LRRSWLRLRRGQQGGIDEHSALLAGSSGAVRCGTRTAVKTFVHLRLDAVSSHCLCSA